MAREKHKKGNEGKREEIGDEIPDSPGGGGGGGGEDPGRTHDDLLVYRS